MFVLSVLRLFVLSSMLFVIVFHSLTLFRDLRYGIVRTNIAQEILLTFNLMREDILKAVYVRAESSRIYLRGFLMSLSDEENDSGWGVVLSCADGIALVYNISSRDFLWVLGDTLELHRVLGRRKVSEKLYELWLEECPPPDSVGFSDVFDVLWYSEGGKIYRETFRNDGSRVFHSKFLVSRGEISIFDGRVVIQHKGLEMAFEVEH